MAKKKTAMLAMIEPKLAKALKRKLITEELTYRAWLESRIAEFVGHDPSKSKPRRNEDG